MDMIRVLFVPTKKGVSKSVFSRILASFFASFPGFGRMASVTLDSKARAEGPSRKGRTHAAAGAGGKGTVQSRKL